MSRAHALVNAQMAERHTLDVLHFEQQRVARARKALQEAQAAEAVAASKHQQARDAREMLERPEAEAATP